MENEPRIPERKEAEEADAVFGPPEPPKPTPSPAWSRWDGCFLGAALLAAGCYFFAHFPYIFQKNGHLPGIGLTLTQWLLMGTALLAAGKKGRLQWKGNPGGIFLLAIALGQGLLSALTGNDSLRLLNQPVTYLTTTLALLSLTQINPLPALSGAGLRLGLRRFVPGFFAHCLLPFRALKALRSSGSKGTWSALGAGIVLGAPVVVIALLLLSSADQMFGSLLEAGARQLNGLDGSFFVRLLYTLIGALFLFSFLRSTAAPPCTPRERKEYSFPAASLITVLSMLAAVYAVFAYIQFRYLFFGAQEIIAREGFAEYARSGFFQLVLLAVLTLLLILPCLALGKSSRGVRALCAVVAALTVVIDVSAFLRMRLYIEAYGLSILRLITLWGMLMILLALLGCMVKCVYPHRPICPALAAVALSTWLLMNLGSMDRMVARYQISAFNEGTLSQLDVGYLSSLSPDVLPELQKIQDPVFRQQATDQARQALQNRFPCAYDWSFTWLHLP